MTQAEVVHLFPQQKFIDSVQEVLIARGYKLEEEAGRGSFGIVYQIRSSHGDSLCLKVLAIPSDDKPKVIEAVEILGVEGILEREKYPQEIRNHHVIHVSESFSATVQGVEIPFVVSELIQGKTLEAHVATGAVSQKEIRTYSHGIADAVAAMHREWIVHRDLKPDNVMIDSRFHRSVIFDFTLAEKVEDEGKARRRERPKPSSRFCAPELESDVPSPYLDHRRCDVWAEGILLYYLHTGRNPKEEARERKVSLQTLVKENVPRRYRSVIGRCLQEEPEKRFADGQAVAKTLKWSEWYYALRLGVPALVLPVVATLATTGYLYFRDIMHTYNLNGCKEAVEVTKDFRSGEHACAAALEYEGDSQTYLYLGHTLLEQGKYSEAKNAYTLAYDRDHTKGRSKIGNFVVAEIKRKVLELENNEKNDHAIAALEILIGMDVKHASSYYSSLAHLLLAEGQYEDAASFLRLVPYYEREKDEKKEAKDIIDSALEGVRAAQQLADEEHVAEKHEKPKVYIEDFRTVALWYKEQGKVKDALYFAEKVLKFTTDEIDPSDNALAECHFLIGDIHFAAGDYDNAFPAYYKGNEISPIRPDVFVNIATIWVDEKNYRGAREVLRRARDLYRNDLESTRIRLQTASEKRPTAHIEYDPLIADLETKIARIDSQLSHIPK